MEPILRVCLKGSRITMVSKAVSTRPVVHTVGGLQPRLGGLAHAVSQLTSALADDGAYRIVLLSQGERGESPVPLSGRLEKHIGLAKTRVALKLGWPLKKVLQELIIRESPALLHDNGIWTPGNHHVAAIARRHNIPLVVHPHGMLEPWALQRRFWKKLAAFQLYQRRDLGTTTLFVATAEQEAENIRRLGLQQPIAVIPHGVEVVGSDFCVLHRPEAHRGERIVAFLGRIHPKKGLLNLVEAWGRLRPQGWRLRLAGPDEGGHLAEVRQKVRALELDGSIEYVGEVQGVAKEELFKESELFVLPSFSENFGVVVVEAMAHGVAVITTRGAPWAGLSQHGCGWWIDTTVDALTETLRQALSMDSVELRVMGERGRVYASEFEWERIAQQTADVYRWLLERGGMPACVVCD